jgi:hypothetical protein
VEAGADPISGQVVVICPHYSLNTRIGGRFRTDRVRTESQINSDSTYSTVLKRAIQILISD